MQLGAETMKMARIANLDYATATDYMTAALRGFNMELNEASATRVNDVYSNYNTEKEPHKEILSEKLGHEETRTPTR